MSQSLVFALLGLALALPVLGAIVLRILAPRLTPLQLYSTAALVFGVAFLSVLLLARANVSSLQVGDLSLLLPDAGSAANRPASSGEPPTAGAPTIASTQPTTTTAIPTPAAATPSAAPAATATPTTAPTATATPTAAPTSVPPTAPPTAAPPTETPRPSGRRTYVVQPGDTLRSIAEQFGVSVSALLEANHLTPAQADSLRIGQELIIP